MSKFTKISQSALDTLQLDAGVLLYNFDPVTAAEPSDDDIICATSGGVSISCVPTYIDMGEDVDNCPVGAMELKKLEKWTCKIRFTSLGMSAEDFHLALGAADVSGTKLTPRSGIRAKDFRDIWWVGDTTNGKMVAVRLLYALSTGGLELKSSKNGKGQLEVELTGHISLGKQDVVPMELYACA